MPALQQLGRRERQIMDAVIRLGRASAHDVRAELPDAPAPSTVRTMLRVLETKGYLRHAWDGPRFVYFPATSPASIRRSAVRHMLRTFFDDSLESAVASLLGSARRPSEDELARVERMIAHARKRAARGERRS
ncbi:MAG TPA: BlaI/MecI/CopY family transcriptional regulator [Candidatus Eisenbacteria bacterium]|nr:BlaI/MecI/CopY family transcriptional regulator [Candidatus Eisenbacteria bacterium]